ncbi:MAG: lamin tail domain-containing protein, partial [Lentisphaerae bacterium]|nr:lamin tail domain-containing protein [Lentisphaerota bacterium]
MSISGKPIIGACPLRSSRGFAAVVCTLLLAFRVAQAVTVSENFDTWTGAEAWGDHTNAAGWSVSDGKIAETNGAPSPEQCLWLNELAASTTSWIDSPQTPWPVGSVSYWCANAVGGFNIFEVQYSRDGSNWTAVAVVSNTATAWTEYTHDIGPLPPGHIRIRKTDDDRYPRTTQLLGLDSIRLLPPAAQAYTNIAMRQLEPSSRGTPLIISEIMYHPAVLSPSNGMEFVELFNTEPVDHDISGFKLSGDIAFTFPSNSILPARSFLVVARDPDELAAAYGTSDVAGPYVGDLPNSSGRVRLRHRQDAILLDVEYSDQAPWPVAADGAGHSLVLSYPDFGEASPKAWSASRLIGGSPGAHDSVTNTIEDHIVINEFLAHTDPDTDSIELFNAGNDDVDISGWHITDDPDLPGFTIPAGTVLGPREHIDYEEDQLGFRLSMSGDDIYVWNQSHSRIVDAVRFAAQQNGVATGRYPDGSPGFHELQSPTMGSANAPLWIRDVVINEIMYNPISGSDDDEYVELYNRGSGTVDLDYWRF